MEPEAPNPQPQRARPNPAGQMSRPDFSSDAPSAPPPQQTRPATGPPRDEPPPPPPPAPKKSGGLWLAGLVIAALLAVGYSFMGGSGGSTSTTVNPPAASSQTVTVADETQSPEYQKHKNRDPRQTARLSGADFDARATQAAIDAVKAGTPVPGLSEASPQLKEAIGKGEVKFYSVRAYDTCAQDGDWVTISTGNGAKIGSFMLLKAGTMISIPVIGGQLPNLTLTGDKDGVGGITVGVVTSGGTWYSSVLSPGQSEPIPLSGADEVIQGVH